LVHIRLCIAAFSGENESVHLTHFQLNKQASVWWKKNIVDILTHPDTGLELEEAIWCIKALQLGEQEYCGE